MSNSPITQFNGKGKPMPTRGKGKDPGKTVRISVITREDMWRELRETVLREHGDKPGRPSMNAVLNELIAEYLRQHRSRRGGR